MSPDPVNRHRVLLCAAECVPFAKTGGLADVVAALATNLRRAGHDARIVMPFYRGMFELDDARVRRLPLDPGAWSWRGGPVSAWEYRGTTPTEPIVYFVENDAFFRRGGIYGDAFGEFGDNAWRFGFLATAILALPTATGWTPTIYHLHDWHTAIVAAMARTHPAARRRPDLARARFVTTIHNLAHRGIFPADVPAQMDLPAEVSLLETGEFHGAFSFLKAGLAYSDAITVVSPTYAREILTPEHGFGLDGFLRGRSGRLVGILNGIDEEEWNPATDRHLAAPLTRADLSGKAVCKAELQRRVGLPVSAETPLIGMVSRLDAQKGFDLLLPLLPAIVAQRVQMVFLGSGQPAIAAQLRGAAQAYPRQVATAVRFDNALSHQIEGGSDLFLMPSAFEPCGLNQMYSMRYGTVPVVRATGGLRDTVTPWSLGDAAAPERSDATGFVFYDYAGDALYRAIERALTLCVLRPDLLDGLRRNGMSRDFGWRSRVADYAAVYDRVHAIAPVALP